MLAQASCETIPLADNSVDLIFTDPPYGIKYLHTYEWLASEAYRLLRHGGFVVALCGGICLPRIYQYFESSGLTYFYECQQVSYGDAPIVWRRVNGSNYPIVARAKPILIYSKGPSVPAIGGMQNMFATSAGWTEAKRYHHWGQDVNTCRYYIEYLSRNGDLVVDPFVGSGTTMIAAQLINRRCVGFDIDVDAAVARLTSTDVPHQTEMQLTYCV